MPAVRAGHRAIAGSVFRGAKLHFDSRSRFAGIRGHAALNPQRPEKGYIEASFGVQMDRRILRKVDVHFVVNGVSARR
jgi:hypothetical protein